MSFYFVRSAVVILFAVSSLRAQEAVGSRKPGEESAPEPTPEKASKKESPPPKLAKSLEETMRPEEFKAAGLDKLSEDELLAALQVARVPLLLALDGVQDPHNLGACLRTADACGALAVIVPRDRAAQLTATVRKVAAGARDGTAHVWTLDQPNLPRRVLTGHAGTVTGVAFVPDGSAVLTVGLDGTLNIWDLDTGKGERVLIGDAGAIRGTG